MTPKELENHYKALSHAVIKARQNIDSFCDSVKDVCHHPEFTVYRFKKDFDDGYGGWYQREIAKCSICNKYENPLKKGDWSRDYFV